MEQFGNVLHGTVVDDFVKSFCKYVGAKYGCAVNSATNAIFLTFEGQEEEVTIPSVLPPVVYNALHHAGQQIRYKDDVEWVGSSYELHNFGPYKVIDSAQRVEKDQFKEANDDDLMIFSLYPTKPVGGMDGGLIVSNDRDKIEYFKQRSLNGMSFSENNWERKQISIGWKMYMNSAQAYVAKQNLKKLPMKYKRLKQIRERYNAEFGLNNTSNHLYRINVKNREQAAQKLSSAGITTGIHYTPLHKQSLYMQDIALPKSEEEGKTTLSIPFNEALSQKEVNKIVQEVSACLLSH
jgi:dTDP-4-amino-4,6-dideoxygalactose transaminase